VGAWGFALLAFVGLGMAGISAVATVLAGVSIVVAVWLGRYRPPAGDSADAGTPTPQKLSLDRA
jgi:hypothetical protein